MRNTLAWRCAAAAACLLCLMAGMAAGISLGGGSVFHVLTRDPPAKMVTQTQRVTRKVVKTATVAGPGTTATRTRTVSAPAVTKTATATATSTATATTTVTSTATSTVTASTTAPATT